jgi:hypothetical protein
VKSFAEFIHKLTADSLQTDCHTRDLKLLIPFNLSVCGISIDQNVPFDLLLLSVGHDINFVSYIQGYV